MASKTISKARKGTTKATNSTNPVSKTEAKTFLAKGEAVVKAARAGSKLEKLIGMMQAAKGTTLAEMAKATGWKPTAVRGVIYNAVKKRLGLTVTLTPNEERGTVFAIVGGK
jgi:hypothetical protein